MQARSADKKMRTQRNALSTAQSQRQALSQQAIMAVEILEMDAIDLKRYVEAKSLENPLIDIAEPERCAPLPAASPEDGRRYRSAGGTALGDEDRMEMLERRSWQARQGRPTLRDHLIDSLPSLSLQDAEREIALYLIDSLDLHGFLHESPAQIAEEIHAPSPVVESTLDKLKTLEPCGVFSASLKECLIRQIDEMHRHGPLARAIVESSLDDLLKSRLGKIAKRLGVSIDEVRRARQDIVSLNPYPSNWFDDERPTRYIVADVIIRQENGRWVVEENSAASVGMQLNRDYLPLMEGQLEAGASEYIRQKRGEFDQLRYCLERRSSTLLSVTRAILLRQGRFFEEGPLHLAPLSLAQVARDLEVSESTVSRCVRGKYVYCPYGILPLSYFFARKAPNSEDASAVEAKRLIREIIEAEDKMRPLSDQGIADAMARRGIALSRRTVAKYRQAMEIANACGRTER